MIDLMADYRDSATIVAGVIDIGDKNGGCASAGKHEAADLHIEIGPFHLPHRDQ
jgi:hypothetical protein